MAKPTNQQFGGKWTQSKLSILDAYLDAYTTALKKQPFRLLYIDAFAGTGSIRFGEDEEQQFIDGSAKIAVKHLFDEFCFIEKDPKRFRKLSSIKHDNGNLNINCHQEDANEKLIDLCHSKNWWQCRAVLFLDPFATELQWRTLEAIAKTQAIDTWILVPISAIERLMPANKQPDDVDPTWPDKLNLIFGDESWRDLYRQQPTLFGDVSSSREVNVVFGQYKKRLESVFGDRLLQRTRELKNDRNRILYHFVFCAGHPRGRDIAHRIAKHIIDHI